MQLISIVLIVFGVGGIVAALYLRFTVKSPVQSSQQADQVIIGGLTLEQIFNILFLYLAVLHLMFVLIGINFLSLG